MFNYFFMVYLLVISIANILVGSTPPYTITSGMNIIVGVLCFLALSIEVYKLTDR